MGRNSNYPLQPFNTEEKITNASTKPIGLWYEVEGDWRRWCESEQPEWVDNLPIYEVELGDENILFITSAEEIDEFTKEYSLDNGVPEAFRFWHLNWERVSVDYDGIEIAPYIWERRLAMHTGWYYGWDCASGCIWRPKGAKLVGPINVEDNGLVVPVLQESG